MAAAPETIHATCIAVGGRAVLLRGPSGSGKSDLALRCLTLAPTPLTPLAAQLVADDRVVLRREGQAADLEGAGRLRIVISPEVKRRAIATEDQFTRSSDRMVIHRRSDDIWHQGKLPQELHQTHG